MVSQTMPENYAGKTLQGRPFSARNNLRGANFRESTLRGVNFKGLDLSNADFTDADIKGADFTDAILNGADFTDVKSGLQRRWVVTQFIILMLSLATSLLAVAVSSWSLANLSTVILFSGGIFASFNYTKIPFAPEQYLALPVILTIAVNAIILIAIVRQGFTAKAFATITSWIVTTIAIIATISVITSVTYVVQYASSIGGKVTSENA
jgi:Pentapeptide repeats (8 copies)